MQQKAKVRRFDAGDAEAAMHAAHSLKGSAGNFVAAGTFDAADAVETATRHGDLAASLAATGELVKDLWGHLPERQRQQILQPLSEDFLPKYATEIEEYFRALADPDRRPPESP